MAITDLEIRHLQAMRAVAELRSFSKAADELGFTQSAISQQIAGLERTVGEQLFHRPGGPRPVELTPAGRLLLTHAVTILDLLDDASRELEAFRSGDAGRVEVGSFQSASTRILPVVIARLRKDHPRLDIRLFESDDQSLLVRRLLDGELDLSFVVAPVEHERIEVTALMDDPFMLVSPVDQADDGRPVSVAELRNLRLIGQQPHDACQARIDQGLRQSGVTPRYVFRSGDNGAVQAMVRAGEGHSVMARLALDAGDPGVAIRQIDPPLPPRTIAMVRVADRPTSPAAVAFLDHARAVCAELS